MSYDLTRRSFGLLSLGALASGLPQFGFAQQAGYANPQVLEEPEHLMQTLARDPDEDAPLLVDVRSRDDHAAGHIPGAVHLDPNAVVAPYSPVDGTLLPIADIEALLSSIGVSAQRRIVFYDNRGGFHAARMMWLLEYLGHRDVAVLNGGWSVWAQIGGASVTTPTPQNTAVFQSAPSPRRHATAEDVLAHQNAAGAVLIDVRPPKMFAEGHIPWAINIPWAENLGEDKRFRSATALLQHFERFGVTSDNDVIMHCQNGLASAHSYVALRLLGFPKVRVYHRSWAEWGSDPSLPKAVS